MSERLLKLSYSELVSRLDAAVIVETIINYEEINGHLEPIITFMRIHPSDFVNGFRHRKYQTYTFAFQQLEGVYVFKSARP